MLFYLRESFWLDLLVLSVTHLNWDFLKAARPHVERLLLVVADALDLSFDRRLTRFTLVDHHRPSLLRSQLHRPFWHLE